MKKIITAIILSLISVTTYAFVMCAENDAIVIPYGADALSTNNDYWPQNHDVSEMTWRVSTYYGYITGISTCLNSNYNTSQYATNANVNAVGGEQAGQYCWCKLLHPAVSYWSYYTNRSSLSSCLSYCASDCAYYVRSSWTFLNNLTNAIAD